MTGAGETVKRFRRARGLSQKELSLRTAASGRRVSESHITKVESNARRLTDDVLERLAAALELSESERAQLETARTGSAPVDVLSELGVLEAKMSAGFERLSGEIRGQINQVNDRLDRLRDTLRP